MSLKTILTMLILGSSSVALAQPMVRDHRDLDTSSITISGGVQASAAFSTSPSYSSTQYGSYQYGSSNDRYDHDRYDKDRYADRFDHRDRSRWNRGRWNRGYERDRFGREVMLAPARTMSLTNDGNAYHAVDPRMGRVMSLQLDGLAGPQYIEYVVLQLADGTDKQIPVHRRLDERHRYLTINLGRYGTSLRGIAVFGSSPTRTGLQITGVVR